MNHMVKVLSLLIVVMSFQSSEAFSSKRPLADDYDVSLIQQELGIYYKGYYSSQLEGALGTDNWQVELRHPEAKRIKRTTDWPTISRGDFDQVYKDIENQIESVDAIITESVRRVAVIFEVEEANIEGNWKFLAANARVLLEEDGFDTQEKRLITLRNFKNYLDKKKPDPLVPVVSLDGFMDYLGEQKYTIPEGYKEDAKNYLSEYFFGQ